MSAEPTWRKSSHSGPAGSCVEVIWRRSSHSGVEGNCVEVAPLLYETGIRDSKNINGGELRTTSRAWRSFVAAVCTGRV